MRSPALLGPGLAYAQPASSLAGPGGSAGAWTREVPGTAVELIVELDGWWDVEVDGARHGAQSFAGGLVAAPVRTRTGGAVRLVQLRLDPLTVPAVLGVPAGELTAVVRLDDLLGREAERLRDQLDASSPDGGLGQAAVDLAASWVEQRVRDAPALRRAVPPDVQRARALLQAGDGRLRVSELAGELRCSRRHLSRRFRTFFGVSPTDYVRLLRFERATAALRRDPSQPLGRLAASCGYADHSHMVRDFHALAGAPPSTIAADWQGSDAVARPVPSVQDVGRRRP